uniref:Uncharacterized protein n=1 Tax=Rhizophora mucronata TaxID=61149 RepID=A0A2P2QEZ2_RHIMU
MFLIGHPFLILGLPRACWASHYFFALLGSSSCLCGSVWVFVYPCRCVFVHFCF